MPEIRIKSLPVQQYADIDETNIMIIEDAKDTKQVSVKNLKLLFSADAKINALRTELKNYVKSTTSTFVTNVDNIDKTVKEYTAKIDSLYSDHEQTKARLGELQEQYVKLSDATTKLQQDVKALQSDILSHDKLIQSIISRTDKLETDNIKNKQDIQNIIKKNTAQDTIIANIQKDIAATKESYNQQITDIIKTISENKQNASDYADTLYNDAITFIDYYHHIHDNPPNWDDPYSDPATTTHKKLMEQIASLETRIAALENK